MAVREGGLGAAETSRPSVPPDAAAGAPGLIPSLLTWRAPRQVSYRAQQGDTRRAVRKMVLVWVLAFLLYGPAILSWEHLSGGSSIPEDHCYAEFFYNWYFLITASTLEFFTSFLIFLLPL